MFRVSPCIFFGFDFPFEVTGQHVDSINESVIRTGKDGWLSVSHFFYQGNSVDLLFCKT